MKWPASITMVRHGESAYNALRTTKSGDKEYQKFLTCYGTDPTSSITHELAEKMWRKYGLKMSDYSTPLSEKGYDQAYKTGRALSSDVECIPDVVLVSPYLRTQQTWAAMQEGGFKANGARIIIEDRIREQEHGLSTIYSDWRIFHVMHPEQKLLREQMGPYWYQYPQGESVSMVRDRMRDVTTMMIREFSSLHVLLITHHLTILSVRANYERLSPEQFIHLDDHEKPVNCGVTRYVGDPRQGSEGRLILKEYNTKHY
jgi:probable phosphoglycerate mutase